MRRSRKPFKSCADLGRVADRTYLLSRGYAFAMVSPERPNKVITAHHTKAHADQAKLVIRCGQPVEVVEIAR